MDYTLEAACMCDKGALRGNNEDNFCFNGCCMKNGEQGLAVPLELKANTEKPSILAVFDGVGGEAFGEEASLAAAKTICAMCEELSPFTEIDSGAILKMINDANAAVVQRARDLQVRHMGCTVAMLCVTSARIYVCNVGDSRIYRLRDGCLERLSEDDADISPFSRGKKPSLTQCLGIDPTEMRLEPHLREIAPEKGDRYLLCSDGLTDMLPEMHIATVMDAYADTVACAAALCGAALERGGRDNITVLICKID